MIKNEHIYTEIKTQIKTHIYTYIISQKVNK